LADRADALNAHGESPERTPKPAFVAALLAVALFQIIVFLWFWTVPLPNAAAAKTTLHDGSTTSIPLARWHLLAQAVPQLVPGTLWNQSLLGVAVDRLSRLDHLHQRARPAAAGLLVAAAAIGLGTLVLRALRVRAQLDAPSALALSFPLGSTLLAALALGFGRIGLLAPWPVRAALAALAVAGGGCELVRFARSPRRLCVAGLPGALAFTIVAAPFLLLMVLNSLQPSIEFDSLEYHLQGPKEWFLAGRVHFLPHNVYTSMPFSVEMLHLLAMHVAGDWWTGALAGQFVIMSHSVNTALAVGLAARAIASPRAGWCAALVYLSSPWTYRLSGFAWVEGPLNDQHAALLLAFLLSQSASAETRRSAWWSLIGAFAGGAMACKYPGLLSAVIPAACLAVVASVRGHTPRLLAAFALGLLPTIGPWLVKNAVDHANPVYPLANSVFHGHPWSPARETQWSRAHAPRPVTAPDLVAGASEVAGRNDWQSPLYLALAPLAFLRRETRRIAAALTAYALYLFATWWLFTHRLDRFWLPILVPLAVLAGLGAAWSKRLGWTCLLPLVLALGLASNWFFNTTELAGLNRWTDDLNVLRRDVPRIASPTLAWLDENLPANSKVLLIGQAGVFHLTIDHLYNTVFDDEIFQTIARERSPAETAQALRDRGVTHVLVDWAEIERHRKPGGYGFSSFVTPALFDGLVRAGVLAPSAFPLPQKSLFKVR
jgi:hypothetical protein